MTTKEQWKLGILIAAMLIIAASLSYRRAAYHTNQSAPASPSYQRPVPNPQLSPTVTAAQQATADAAAAKQKANEEAAEQHAQFLARYLNPGVSRKAGVEMVAVVVVSEDGKMNRGINVALTDHFKTKNADFISSVFRPEFVSDGLFASVIGGSSEIPRKLDLANTLDALLLAQQQVQYSTNPDMLNVITANMQLEVFFIPVSGNDQGRSWTFTANGAGFNNPAARQLAEERLIRQIAKDAKMSLN